MIIDVKKLKTLYPVFSDINDDLLTYKLSAIEVAIRQYTNNNFQNRGIRGAFYSKGTQLITDVMPPFRVGDTVMISASKMNNGLFVIQSISGNTLTVDNELYEANDNLVTKVEYPMDVVSGAINILMWDCFDRDKVGIASETISRHSVSYQQYDGANTINGYPSMLFGFCSNYMRART